MNLYLSIFTHRGKQFVASIIRHESGEKAADKMLTDLKATGQFPYISESDIEVTLLSADGPIGKTDYLALIKSGCSTHLSGW